MLRNLHLGVRDVERGGFVMLGKTFKGLTDDLLAWQTKKLRELEIARDTYTVYVRPELVVETRSTIFRKARSMRAASRCDSRA